MRFIGEQERATQTSRFAVMNGYRVFLQTHFSNRSGVSLYFQYFLSSSSVQSEESRSRGDLCAFMFLALSKSVRLA